MMEALILIGGMLMSFAVGYFAIGKLFDLLEPESSPEKKYRIASDDLVVLFQMKNYFDPKECTLFTGCDSEIVSELRKTKIDFAILESNPANPQPRDVAMNHIQATYRPYEPAASNSGMHVFMLTDRTRNLDIYYRDALTPVIHKMLGNSLIKENIGH